MNNFRYKMARFFAGRTGVDSLGRFFTWLALILMIATMITHSNIVYLMAMGCLVYSIWRMFSKNYQKRYRENQWFLNKTEKLVATDCSFQFGQKEKPNYQKNRIKE